MTSSHLALIGNGRWGSVIKKTLASLPDAELSYEVTHEWKELLEKDDIDGVIIATPPATHLEIALPFIQKGIPVFIEKPMTLSVSDAETLLEASNTTGVPVFVGHLHLYNPAFLGLKEVLKKSGHVRLIVSEGTNNGPYRNDYSALWDWAPHDISMMLSIMGEMPITVRAWATATTRPHTTLWDSSQIELTFPSSTRGYIANSWLSPIKKKNLTVMCEDNTLVYDDVLPEKKLIFYEGMGPRIQGDKVIREEPTISYPEYDTIPPLTAELEAFIKMVRTKESPVSDARLGLQVVTILEKAEESIVAGGVAISL